MPIALIGELPLSPVWLELIIDYGKMVGRVAAVNRSVLHLTLLRLFTPVKSQDDCTARFPYFL